MKFARRLQYATLLPRHPARALVLFFAVLVVAGGLLLHLPICVQGEQLEWSAAFFTATSAVSVTGLSVFDVRTTLSPFGQVVLLLLIQAGGLGYMLASTLMLLIFGREPRLHERLLLKSALGEVTLGDTARLVLRAVLFALCVEALGAFILATRLVTLPEYSDHEYGLVLALWHGVFHAVSAFCNAGFDLFGIGARGEYSLAAFRGDVIVNLTIAALIISGGLGFAVYQELIFRWRQRAKRGFTFSLHTRLVLWMTLWLNLLGMLAFLATEWSNAQTLGRLPVESKLLAAFFQSVTLRTAGFSTLDFGVMRSITLLVSGIWMFIGASPGSTGGGVKTTTFATALLTVRAALRGGGDVEIFNRRIATEAVYRALVLIFLSFAIVVAGLSALTFTEPTALREAGVTGNLFTRIQFEALSAFGTVGLSTGITPFLTESGRVVLMLLMFVGRLGPVTAATALTASASPLRRRLPEEQIALG